MHPRIPPVGRNDPCPCASGQKYKKCHGSPLLRDVPAETERAANRTLSTTVPLGGLSGQRQDYYAIVPGKPLTGSPGKYRVIFTLSRSSEPEQAISFDPELAGDSYIVMPKEEDVKGHLTPREPDPAEAWGADPATAAFAKVRVEGSTPEGEFVWLGHPNELGRLARLACETEGQTFHEVGGKTWRSLTSSLSNWSAQLDMPIHIRRVHITELTTDSMMVSWTAPFLDAPLAIAGEGSLSPEFRGFSSLYREALGSNSPVYQFLCFFKIIEGLRKRRTRLERLARKKGLESPSSPIERFPSTEAEFRSWLQAIFHVRRDWDKMALDSMFPAEVRGTEFKRVIDDQLSPLRVEIAHALLESELSKARGEPASVDSDVLSLSTDHSRKGKVDDWLPVIKCIVRRMMKSDFGEEFLPFLGDNGQIRS